MKEQIQKKLSDSKAARWTALMIVSFTMMCGYFLTDVMSPLENLLTTKGKVVYFTDDTSMPVDSLTYKVDMFAAANSLSTPSLNVAKLESGAVLQYMEQVDGTEAVVEKTVDKIVSGENWSSSEYGFFSGAYGFINVFLLMLFFGGIILDKMGIRFTGVMSSGLMFVGALIKWYALATDFGGATMWGVNLQVALASLGFAVFGVGAEITGITVSKVIVKWFSGKELALAMGLQVAMARIGTAVALAVSLPIARAMGGVSYPVLFGAIALCIGLVSYLVYCVMDKKEDAAVAAVRQQEGQQEEEGFHIADLKLIFCSRGFWLVTLLCLMFYAGVFPFLKFATKLMIYKYNVPESFAGLIPAVLPFGTILLTPIFGTLYDRIGKGATLMIIGSVMLTVVHVLFAMPFMNYWWFAVVVMVVLGIAFSLVPSAMWPSVPKIIPMKQLGSAYAIIFYIQNIGLTMVPWLIGWVIQDLSTTYNEAGQVVGYNYSIPMAIFAIFGFCAIVIAFMLRVEDGKKHYGLEEANIKK
ncbi:MFS transporter [uncultured Bacteroides sp.]|uniref:MFS transporter n=1 Tax=uncultured Bacteroides sp. TaxID=162156 RepID=UPI0026285FF9|nr:MFS transporter [uncultured Bacteroides sp.]